MSSQVGLFVRLPVTGLLDNNGQRVIGGGLHAGGGVVSIKWWQTSIWNAHSGQPVTLGLLRVCGKYFKQSTEKIRLLSVALQGVSCSEDQPCLCLCTSYTTALKISLFHVFMLCLNSWLLHKHCDMWAALTANSAVYLNVVTETLNWQSGPPNTGPKGSGCKWTVLSTGQKSGCSIGSFVIE